MQVGKFLVLVVEGFDSHFVEGFHLDLVEGFGFDLVGDFPVHY